MPLSDLTVRLDQDRAIIALRGEHEAYTAHKLARQLEALLDEGVPVGIDLREATFLDSTVVGVLLGAKRHADERALEFVLLMSEQTGWPVRRLLEVTGLNTTFTILDD
jgi:anti-anti-sigma factor